MATSEGDPAWLTREQLQDWLAVLALTQALPAALDTQLKRDAGINGFEYHVLATLSQAPEHSMHMSQLAVLAQGSQSRLSHAVGRLEKAGWVSRRPSSENARYIEARLTEAGWQKIQQVAPGHVGEARRLVIDALTPSQLRQLGRAANRIVQEADPNMALWLNKASDDAT